MRLNIFQSIQTTKVIFIGIILVCMGILIYTLIYRYNYSAQIKKENENIFLMSRDSKNSLDWGIVMSLEDIRIDHTDNNDSVDLITKDGQKVYSGKRSDFLGGDVLESTCNGLRLEVTSSEPNKINMTGIECQEN